MELMTMPPKKLQGAHMDRISAYEASNSSEIDLLEYDVFATLENLALQTEAYNGSVPTSLFITGLGNGSLTGAMLPHSSSSSQLAKDSSLMEEILVLARAQWQIMHQLESMSNIVHEYWGERTHQDRIDNTTPPLDAMAIPVLLTLAVGSFSLFLYKTFTSHK